MGWFWADQASLRIPKDHTPVSSSTAVPPPGCPMHQKGADALKAPVARSPPAKSPESACPYTPTDVSRTNGDSTSSSSSSSSSSFLSKMNPLNYMFSELSQEKAPEQKIHLDIEREPSTIPRGAGDGNWEYPSPQQMYNALLRKGYADTDPTAVTAMVSVHNFLNEGAWKEIRVWEGMFSSGLKTAWTRTQNGEAGIRESEIAGEEPSLMRFQGRPQEMTPKAAIWQAIGWLYPAAFGTEPPFDRHDWYVTRKVGDQTKEIRYVIDYYAAPDDEEGNPVFNLDVRPAVDSPILAAERLIRAGGEFWYKASGAEVRSSGKN